MTPAETYELQQERDGVIGSWLGVRVLDAAQPAYNAGLESSCIIHLLSNGLNR